MTEVKVRSTEVGKTHDQSSADAKHKPPEFQLIDDRSSQPKFKILFWHVQIKDSMNGDKSKLLN